MITDADRTFLTLGNMTTLLANNSTSISLFIHQDSDLFPLFDVLIYAHLSDFGKIGIELFGHVHQKDILVRMLKFFVVHD